MKVLGSKMLAGIGLASLAINSVSANNNNTPNWTNTGGAYNTEATQLKGTKGTTDLAGTIADVIQWALGFLFLIAVIIAMWAGFQILTAGGEDDKVSKGKKILIQAVIGIVVIMFAYLIVGFIFDSVTDVA